MFDKNKAQKVKTFISKLPHTKGKWAGESFVLLDWQIDLIDKLYGTVKADGTRQYRICYCEIPKKNGKTELGGALALYHLCADNEASPEVYSAAADREQASIIYGVASYMTKHTALNRSLKVRDSRKRIIYEKNNGYYQVLSSEVATKHGISPSCVIFDELHAQPNDELWRVLTSGTDYARSQQTVIVLTTAGVYDKESVWWRVREKARQVEAGIIKDDSFLPILYIADPEKDKEDDEELWKRVNPSLGRIFTLDKIRRDYEIAKNNPVEIQDFKRYRLNIPIKQLIKWMDMRKWDKCSQKIDLEALKGRSCYGGLDFSSTQDMTSFVLVFPFDDAPAVVLCWFYCPEETIYNKSKSDAVHYDIWAEKGLLTATPGDYVDYQYVKKDVLEAAGEYDIKEIGFDPWNNTQLATDLIAERLEMVEVRQGTRSLSEPSKDILKKILAKLINHLGNPILRWNTDNVVMIQDANENIRPTKDKSTGRIDGFVALIMAWSRVILSEGNESVYEKRGVLEI